MVQVVSCRSLAKVVPCIQVDEGRDIHPVTSPRPLPHQPELLLSARRESLSVRELPLLTSSQVPAPSPRVERDRLCRGNHVSE